MLTVLFEKFLVSPRNIREVAEFLKEFLVNRQVVVKATRADGKVFVHNNLTLYPLHDGEIRKNGGGIQLSMPDDRGGLLTNSAHLSLLFKSNDPQERDLAWHFETSDDPIIERLGFCCLVVTVKTNSRDDFKELVFSVIEETESGE